MAISTYTSLLPSMTPRLPDCSSYMILQALWLMGRDFCVESEAYVQKLTAIDTVADQEEYTLTTPTEFDPLRVTTAWRRTETNVTDGDEGLIIPSTSYEFAQATNVLKFYEAPFTEVITSGLVVELALAPQEDADGGELDFEWVRRWAEYIKAGALYHLMSMEKMAWYSPNGAALNFQTYRTGIGYARREKFTQNTTKQMRMTAGEASWL